MSSQAIVKNTDHRNADYSYMARAIHVAKKGQYISKPNPYVGCVLVKENRIIGEGYTQQAGQAHAEVDAINKATEPVNNATAYVTLEPCSHTGRTPPCADTLVKSGIKRVVISMLDPNPQVAGRGVKTLLDANIDVSVGLLEAQAREMNRGFFKRMEQGVPFVRVKMAMSLDGKTAMASGESQWITGDKARQDVQRLRAQSDAILTGSGTVIDDDPSLNVRISPRELALDTGSMTSFKQPLRVVLDTHLKMMPNAKMLSLPGNTLIYTCCSEDDKTQQFSSINTEVSVLPEKQISLKKILQDLALREINDVHVEAGATLCGALITEGLVDEIIIYMAPTLLGGDARSLFTLSQLKTMKNTLKLDIKDIRSIGKDWRITAIPRPA